MSTLYKYVWLSIAAFGALTVAVTAFVAMSGDRSFENECVRVSRTKAAFFVRSVIDRRVERNDMDVERWGRETSELDRETYNFYMVDGYVDIEDENGVRQRYRYVFKVGKDEQGCAEVKSQILRPVGGFR